MHDLHKVEYVNIQNYARHGHKRNTKSSPNDISGLSHQKSGAIHNDGRG